MSQSRSALWVLLVGSAAVCSCRNEKREAPPPPSTSPAATASARVEELPPPQPVDLWKAGEGIPEQIVSRNPNSLLGGEIGLDHAGIAVPDLDAADRAFTALGFARPQRGKLPNGIQNVNFYFGNATYLELLNAYDRAKAGDVARFLDLHGQGLMFFVLAVFSAEETTRFLKGQGVALGKPLPGRIETRGAIPDERPMWHTLLVQSPPFPGNPFFFIAYNRTIRNVTLKGIKDQELRRRAFAHPNKAVGLKSVWLAVRDLDSAIGLYARLGLGPGRRIQDPYLGATGTELQVGQGTLRIFGPSAADTPIGRFLAARDAGLVGVSIEVEKLSWTRGLLQHNLKTTLPSYTSISGPAALVRPELAGGSFIEFFEPAAALPTR